MRGTRQLILVVIGINGNETRIPVTLEEYQEALKAFQRIEGASDCTWHNGTDANHKPYLLGLDATTLGMFLETDSNNSEGLVDFTVRHQNGGLLTIRVSDAKYEKLYGAMQEPKTGCLIPNWGFTSTDANGNNFRVLAGIKISAVYATPVKTSHEELLGR